MSGPGVGSPMEVVRSELGVQDTVRLVTSLVGVAVILIGLYYAMQLFGLIRTGLKQPGGLEATLAEWTEVLGGETLTLQLERSTIPLARVLAVVLLGGGTGVLALIALAMMRAGAYIVSWTGTDYRAVQRMVSRALGRDISSTPSVGEPPRLP